MKRRVLSSFGVAALAAAAMSLSCSPSIPKYEFPHAEMRAKLDNGLKMVIMPDPSTPLVQVDVHYNTGSNQDPPGKAGIAHFAEHMQFQYRLLGPDKPPVFDLLPQITTFFNAFTAPDTTHYMLQGRKEELETFLRIEAARMAGDCRSIPPEEFEREREVVRNELRQNYGRPEAEIPSIIHREVFSEGHPYYYLGIGNDEQLTNITLEDVCVFIDEYYVPQNATVIVAGNVDPEETGKLVEFTFGGIEKGLGADRKPRSVKAAPIPVPEIKHRTVVKELPVERESVHIVWALPPSNTEEGELGQSAFVIAGLVNQFNAYCVPVLTEQTRVCGWDFAYGVYAQSLGGNMAPLLVLTIEPKPGKMDEALDFVWKATKQAHRLFEPGAASDESKNRQIGRFIAQFEDLTTRTVSLGNMVQYRADFDWDSADTYVYNEFKRIQEQDPGDAGAIVKKLLRKSRALVLVVKKDKSAEGFRKSKLEFSTKSHDNKPAPLVDPAEATKPLIVPKEESALVNAHRFTLGNGMRVVLLPEGSRLPVVSMQLIFNAGAAHEPEGHEGLADIAADFLNHNRQSEIGIIGASWGAFVGDDVTVFTVNGLNIYTKKMVQGLERLIKAGEYHQPQIEGWQKAMRDALEYGPFRQQRAFTREVAIAVWGPSHPYAVKGMATPSSVGKIGRDDADDFRNKHYTAKNATLIVAGNFDAEAAEHAIRNNFGEWSGGHEDSRITEPAEQKAGRAIAVIGDKLPQVRVAIQYPAPAGVDGQEAARLVLADMIRLKMFEIRTELGSTYGVGAGRETKLGPSRYIIQGGIQSERVGETIRVMRAKIDDLRNGVEFNKTFAQARRNVLKSLLSESTVSRSLAGRLGQIAIYRQDPDYYEKLTQYVAKLSPAQVKTLIANELKAENEVIALLGDKETMDKALNDAGITDFKFVDVTE
jgi:zinc protease